MAAGSYSGSNEPECPAQSVGIGPPASCFSGRRSRSAGTGCRNASRSAPCRWSRRLAPAATGPLHGPAPRGGDPGAVCAMPQLLKRRGGSLHTLRPRRLAGLRERSVAQRHRLSRGQHGLHPSARALPHPRGDRTRTPDSRRWGGVAQRRRPSPIGAPARHDMRGWTADTNGNACWSRHRLDAAGADRSRNSERTASAAFRTRAHRRTGLPHLYEDGSGYAARASPTRGLRQPEPS